MSSIELNYKNYTKDYPIYQYVNINKENIVNLQEDHKTEIDIPLEVINLNNTRLSFDYVSVNPNLPDSNFCHLNGITPIKHIYLVNDKGFKIGVENMNKYSNMTFRHNNKYTDVLTWENDFHEGLSPSNVISNGLPTGLYLEGNTYQWTDISDLQNVLTQSPIDATEVNDVLIGLTYNINNNFQKFITQFKLRFNHDIVLVNYPMIRPSMINASINAFNVVFNLMRTKLATLQDELDTYLLNNFKIEKSDPIETTVFNIQDDQLATTRASVANYSVELNDNDPLEKSLYNYFYYLYNKSHDIALRFGIIRDNGSRPNVKLLHRPLEVRYLKNLNNFDALNNTIKFNFNLGKLKDSIFGYNKDLFFGSSNRMKLVVVWNSPNKTIYTNSYNNYTSGININNLHLKLCVEKNPLIISEVKNNVNKGFEIITPYLHTYHNPISSTFFNKYYEFNLTHGFRLNKIYFTVYNDNDHNEMEYERNIITNFYTSINDKKTRLIDYDTSKYDDYFELKQKLKGSCILSANEYYYNHTFIEDFTNENFTNDNDNLLSGYILTSDKMKYTVNINLTSNTGQFIMYVVTQKKLLITNNDLLLS